MVTRRDRVARSCSARDQHMPGVFLPALARVGYGLLFWLRKVPIWTSEGRLTLGGFPEKARVLHALVSGGFFPVLVFLGSLVV
jgi:hypothetical protein